MGCDRSIPLKSGRGWGAHHTHFASLNTRAKKHSVKLKRKKKRKLKKKAMLSYIANLEDVLLQKITVTQY